MVPPEDIPPGEPPGPPPPPPAAEPAPVAPARTTTTSTVQSAPEEPVVPPPAGPNPWLMLLLGIILGLLIGGGVGYLLFHSATTATPTTGPSSSATAQPTVSSVPSIPPTSTPEESAPASATAAAAQGVVPCPVTTPPGQHQLGSPGGPSAGTHADPNLDFCGRGSATIPAGTTRFTTGNNWGLGTAHSCPQGSSGQGGMDTTVTISELQPDGSQGTDTDALPGDWSESGGSVMNSGGNYQLQVTTVSPDCVWHIAIYPS